MGDSSRMMSRVGTHKETLPVQSMERMRSCLGETVSTLSAVAVYTKEDARSQDRTCKRRSHQTSR